MKWRRWKLIVRHIQKCQDCSEAAKIFFERTHLEAVYKGEMKP